MTIEQFYETLQFVKNLDEKLEIETNLEEVRDALNNLVASPAHPQHQSTLASAMDDFSNAVSGLKGAVTPSQSSAIAAIGGKQFFNLQIYEDVRRTIADNAMTPSVARDFVKDFASRRSEFLETVETTLRGLGDLGVKGDGIEEGSADMAFLIPRDLFENRLGPFAKELTFINRMIEHIAEATNADTQSIKLETLSSSVPTIVVASCAGVILYLGRAVGNFLDAWEKIERIRKLRAEIADIGMKGKALDDFTDKISRTVKEVVEASTHSILEHCKTDAARKNELETALKQDLHKLYAQIARGLTIQLRAEPPQGGNAPETNALEAVKRMGYELQFPSIDGQAMLLSDGQILDSSIPTATSDPEQAKPKVVRAKPRKATVKQNKLTSDGSS